MQEDPRGLALTLGAFLVWGLSPLFWRLLLAIPASQLLAHRILWAALILAALLWLERRWKEVGAVLGSRRVLATLAASTICISTNWLVYIWAIVTERIVQASLGYYINPLVSVLLGMVFLGERLGRARWISLVVASLGVAIMVWRLGELPWISLVLAGTFGFYGLLRKQVEAEAEVGLFIETALLTPLVALFLARQQLAGTGALGAHGPIVDLLLVAAGLITVVPLLLFTHGVRRLPLATVGILQFSAPTLQFLLAVCVFREPFRPAQLAAFLCIWAALAIFSWDLRSRLRVRA
jgi:chloramphenicol-sensitive protein RarD